MYVLFVSNNIYSRYGAVRFYIKIRKYVHHERIENVVNKSNN